MMFDKQGYQLYSPTPKFDIGQEVWILSMPTTDEIENGAARCFLGTDTVLGIMMELVLDTSGVSTSHQETCWYAWRILYRVAGRDYSITEENLFLCREAADLAVRRKYQAITRQIAARFDAMEPEILVETKIPAEASDKVDESSTAIIDAKVE